MAHGVDRLHSEEPTRISAAIFAAKAAVLRCVRFATDLRAPLHTLAAGKLTDYPLLLTETRSPLWTAESSVERSLQLGKVQNLRRACSRLHLVEVPANQVFSFWQQIGKATKSEGYATGRELRQGCLIPTVGGGLCQLSNALYDLALKTGCEIVERHAHTAAVPGSAAAQGRDATIFWNYVDLRFRPEQDILITARLSRDELIIAFRGKHGLLRMNEYPPAPRPSIRINTCTDCAVESCFRNVKPKNPISDGNAAFLIEECWPEFEEFAQQTRWDADELFLPMHPNFLARQRYSWNCDGYSRIVTATLPTVLSSAKARLGGVRNLPPIAAQLERSQKLAEYYGKRLSLKTSHLYVAQSLLPFLWRRGDLGGREFRVFMTRMPLRVLHRKLDDLAARFPERKTFQEFRAPAWMVEAEAEALEHGESIITPHSFLAGMFPRKTTRLAWKLPKVAHRHQPGSCIVFPGPAVARKGAYELREALQGSLQKLVALGSLLESGKFWEGCTVTQAAPDWLDQAAVVVQPAFVENAPRPLLRSLAAGIPVIASPECGIEKHQKLMLVPAGDTVALRDALARVLISRSKGQFQCCVAPVLRNE